MTTLSEITRLFTEAEEFAEENSRVTVRVGADVYDIEDLAYTDGVFYIEAAQGTIRDEAKPDEDRLSR